MKSFVFSRYFFIPVYIYINVLSECTECCCCKKDNNNTNSEQSEDKKKDKDNKKPDKDTILKELDNLLEKDIETIKNFPEDVKKTMEEVIFKKAFNKIIQGEYNYVKGIKDEINKNGINDQIISSFNKVKYYVNLFNDTTKYLTHSLLWDHVWKFDVENYDKNNNKKGKNHLFWPINNIFGYDICAFDLTEERHELFSIYYSSDNKEQHNILFLDKNIIGKFTKNIDKIVELEDNLYYVILSYNGQNSVKFVNENYSVNLNLKKNNTNGIYELFVEIHEKK